VILQSFTRPAADISDFEQHVADILAELCAHFDPNWPTLPRALRLMVAYLLRRSGLPELPEELHELSPNPLPELEFRLTFFERSRISLYLHPSTHADSLSCS
jgi:hypothetical protein